MLGVQEYTVDKKPICKICAKAFDRLLAHVRQKHGINGDDYRKEFGFCKSFAFISKESKEIARENVFKNPHCIKENLIIKGMKTKFVSGGKKCVHTVNAQRKIILKNNRSLRIIKPVAKCKDCGHVLSTRKSKLCLRCYRLKMVERNKK